MKNLKFYIAGVVTGLMLVSVPIFADTVTKSIEALVNFSNIQVNGKVVESDNFVVDGKTYVWIRDVANMLGKNVVWDEQTNTANIIDSNFVSNNTVIATVNDEQITAQDLISYPKNPSAQNAEQAKNMALDELISINIAVSEGKALGLIFDDRYTAKANDLVVQQEQVYGDQFTQMLQSLNMTKETYVEFQALFFFQREVYAKMVEGLVFTPEQIKATYDKNAETFNEVTAKHILIKTIDDNGAPLNNEEIAKAEKKANDLVARLKKGEDFDKLMSEYSQDEGSKNDPKGMTFKKGEMVSEFEKASFEQNINTYYAPVKTQFGYHIILVTKRGPTELEIVKSELETMLKKEWLTNRLDQLKSNAVININQQEVDKIIIQ